MVHKTKFVSLFISQKNEKSGLREVKPQEWTNKSRCLDLSTLPIDTF